MDASAALVADGVGHLHRRIERDLAVGAGRGDQPGGAGADLEPGGAEYHRSHGEALGRRGSRLWLRPDAERLRAAGSDRTHDCEGDSDADHPVGRVSQQESQGRGPAGRHHARLCRRDAAGNRSRAVSLGCRCYERAQLLRVGGGSGGAAVSGRRGRWAGCVDQQRFLSGRRRDATADGVGRHRRLVGGRDVLERHLRSGDDALAPRGGHGRVDQARFSFNATSTR